MRTASKSAEQRIAESKATIWSVLTAWVVLLFLLSIVPLIALSLFLLQQWWP